MDNLTDHLNDSNSESVTIPDLNWLDLGNIEGKEPNIPTNNDVEIIPQLQEQWGTPDTKSSFRLTTNNQNACMPSNSDKSPYSKDDVEGVIKSAKIAAMRGATGEEIASELNAKYPEDLIGEAKEGLEKVASELGLLGNVYVDISAFSSCKEASHKLGPNKIRLAKFIVGECKNACSTHKSGYCSELKKDVVDKVAYDERTLKSYEQHLKIAGKISQGDKIEDKDALQKALLKSNAPSPAKTAGGSEFKDSSKAIDKDELQKRFKKELESKEAYNKELKKEVDFENAKEVLSFIQDNMLKGKMGDSLKEIIAKNISDATIRKYSSEINKMVSLQGLLGTVYADVSYYKNAGDAIKSIRSASTKPQYLIQSVKTSEFDDTLSKVAKATGCSVLPRDGKIDTKIARSYIEDMMFSDRIAIEQGSEFMSAIEAGENVLGVIREAYMATMSHKKNHKTAGVKATIVSKGDRSTKKADIEHLKAAAKKAIEIGVPIDQVEDKLASFVSSVEAAGMMDKVIGGLKEVSADALSTCNIERYPFNTGTVLLKAKKCENCVMNNNNLSCLKQGLPFKGFDGNIDTSTYSGGNIVDEFDIGNGGMNITTNKSDNFKSDSSINNPISIGSGIDETLNNIL